MTSCPTKITLMPSRFVNTGLEVVLITSQNGTFKLVSSRKYKNTK
jgi:hypothetical protein